MRTLLYHSADIEPERLSWWPLCEDLVIASSAGLPEIVDEPALLLEPRGLSVVDPNFDRAIHIPSEEVKRHCGSRSHLNRACGAVNAQFTILDVFGGFGIDALALAHHAQVEVFERDPLIFVMQAELASRFSLPLKSRYGDGVAQLKTRTDGYDAIYLDPMFPKRNKKALPNQAMQFVQSREQQTLEQQRSDTLELDALLESARACANDRVVLKRRSRDPVIGRPNHSIKGKTVRFDVYR